MKETLVVGERYDVDAGDCCLDVAFQATLLSVEERTWPELKTTWDNGVTLRSSASEILPLETE